MSRYLEQYRFPKEKGDYAWLLPVGGIIVGAAITYFIMKPVILRLERQLSDYDGR
jgi:hypothetical protein